MTGVRRNVLWGVAWGLRIAGVFSVVVLVTAGVRVLTESASVTFAALAIGQTVSLYLFGAVVSGGLVGILRPLGKTWAGAVCIGFIAGLPLALAGFMIFLGPRGVTLPVVALSAALAFIWAVAVGTMVWHDP